MYEDEDVQTIPVRIPKHIATALRDIQDQENLPSLGAALKAYIDKIQLEALETRIAEIEEKNNKVLKEITNSINESFHLSIMGIAHNMTFSLLQEKQLINKLGLDKNDIDDRYAMYAYAKGLKLVRKQFEHIKHTECGSYIWVKRQIETLNKPTSQKQEKDSKEKRKKTSVEHVK